MDSFYVIFSANSKNDPSFLPVPSHFPENYVLTLLTDFSMKILLSGQLLCDGEKQRLFSDLEAQKAFMITYRMPEKCSLLYLVTRFFQRDDIIRPCISM